MENVSHQYELRPELPNVYGSLDYRQYREMLMKIDDILNVTGLEHKLIVQALEVHVATYNIDPMVHRS